MLGRGIFCSGRLAKTVPLWYRFQTKSPRDADTAVNLFLVVCYVPAVCDSRCGSVTLEGKRYLSVLTLSRSFAASADDFCSKESKPLLLIYLFIFSLFAICLAISRGRSDGVTPYDENSSAKLSPAKA